MKCVYIYIRIIYFYTFFFFDEIIDIMKHDKKASGDKIIFIIPTTKKQVQEIKLTSDEVREMFT